MRFNDLSEEPASWLRPDVELIRRILKIGAFVMLAMMTQFLVGAADAVMVGLIDDVEVATASQAALGLGTPLFWWVGGFFAAVSYGTQALTARRYGAGNDKAAGQVLFNSIIVGVLAGIAGALTGWFTANPMVDFLAESSVAQADLARAYARIRALGITAMVVTFSYKSFFDGLGRTHVHLIASVCMTAINIGLNFIFIYGHEGLGVPAMALEGAAVASAVSSYLGLAIMIGVSLAPRYLKRFRMYRLKHFDPVLIRDIVRLMLPSGSASVFLMTGFLLFMKAVGRLDALEGTGANTYAAASTVLFYTVGLIALPMVAFGTATATAVSQALGAGKPGLAARAGWEAVRVGVVAVIGVGVLLWVFPEQIVALWNPNNMAVQAAAAGPLRLVATCMPMMAMGLILSQALYGAGANTFVMVVEATLHAGVLVPLSWLFGPYLGYGLMGVWFAGGVYITGLGVAMTIKFSSRGWRSIRL